MNYTKSWIMKKAHKIAASIKEEFNTYKAALSVGLHKAWKIAKGLLPNVEVESARVITQDLGEEFAQRIMGNLKEEVAECA